MSKEKIFSDDDTIRALECCGSGYGNDSCEQCPYEKKDWKQDGTGGCTGQLMRDALALIKWLMSTTPWACEIKHSSGRSGKKENMEHNKMAGGASPSPTMNFGQAIEALKAGKKVARAGWNGRGMYLWLKPATVVKKEWCRDPRLIECIDQNGGEEILALGTICMYTHDSTGRKAVLTGWLASQSDMLCEDWYVVE
jgi:hypothetical protein